jgi:hypothetical protein
MSIAAVCLTSSMSFAQVTYSGQAGPPTNKLALWYSQAATSWMTSALLTVAENTVHPVKVKTSRLSKNGDGGNSGLLNNDRNSRKW